ncbi:MAG: Gfo/Idh/MocA family oxidoreductase [Rhodopirellula sp.]|nr:Gfo/Idh/MocA family oxidoreductase [Rhodopirellula sp.]
MVRQTRRRFLEDTLLAAAAMATTPAAQVWSAEGASTSANEKLGAAVIGVGGRGVSHLDALVSRPDTEVVCIVDCDERTGQQQADQVSQRQGRRPGVYRDMREAFDDPAVDIVSTATPNHWHALVSIWAMQAGKDVYVEKPVSHNVSEGQRIVEVARKYHRICQAGTQCRSMQGTIDAIEFIRSGKIGEVRLARGLCYKRRPSIGPRGIYEPPKEVSYDLWLGPAPLAPVTRPRFHYDWHWQWAYGNGDLGNQGAHQIDVARWALGIDRLSDRVMSYGGRFGYEDAGETANTQVVLHEFGDKTLVFEVRGLVTDDYQGARVGVIVYGTDGYVSLSSYAGGVAFDSDGKVRACVKITYTIFAKDEVRGCSSSRRERHVALGVVARVPRHSL